MSGGKGKESQLWINHPPNSNHWVKKKDLPEGRKGHAAVAFGDKTMIIAGGWNQRGDELKTVYMYNLRSDNWIKLPDMPHSRVDFSLKVKSIYFQMQQVAF